MSPWICEENEEEILSFIKQSSSVYAMGHFDLQGFMMNKGIESKYSSRDKDFLYRYSKVFSGHFHTRSSHDNIEYIGSPYEMNWNDYNDPRGFSVFDTNTGKNEYIDNPDTMFTLINYIDGYDELLNLDNQIVKVIVKSRTNKGKYEVDIENINKLAVDLKISIEDNLIVGEDSYDETKKQLDTRDYLLGWVDRLDIENKSYVKEKLSNLFERANNGII